MPGLTLPHVSLRPWEQPVRMGRQGRTAILPQATAGPARARPQLRMPEQPSERWDYSQSNGHLFYVASVGRKTACWIDFLFFFFLSKVTEIPPCSQNSPNLLAPTLRQQMTSARSCSVTENFVMLIKSPGPS